MRLGGFDDRDGQARAALAEAGDGAEPRRASADHEHVEGAHGGGRRLVGGRGDPGAGATARGHRVRGELRCEFGEVEVLRRGGRQDVLDVAPPVHLHHGPGDGHATATAAVGEGLLLRRGERLLDGVEGLGRDVRTAHRGVHVAHAVRLGERPRLVARQVRVLLVVGAHAHEGTDTRLREGREVLGADLTGDGETLVEPAQLRGGHQAAPRSASSAFEKAFTGSFR